MHQWSKVLNVLQVFIISNVTLLIDCKRCKRMCTGVCERVYQLHYFGSQRAMSSGEAQDHQRRGHPVCHVHVGFWYVRGAAQTLSAEIQRGTGLHSHIICYLMSVLWRRWRVVMFSRRWRVRRECQQGWSQKAWAKKLQKTVSVSIAT